MPSDVREEFYDDNFERKLSCRIDRFLDAFRFVSSGVTGFSITTDHPIIAIASGAAWASSTIFQSVYDRRGDKDSLKKYFLRTTFRDVLSLTAGLIFGYGIERQKGVTPENVVVASLPAYLSGVMHYLSRENINGLEANL